VQLVTAVQASVFSTIAVVQLATTGHAVDCLTHDQHDHHALHTLAIISHELAGVFHHYRLTLPALDC